MRETSYPVWERWNRLDVDVPFDLRLPLLIRQLVGREVSKSRTFSLSDQYIETAHTTAAY